MYQWLEEIWKTIDRIEGHEVLNLSSEAASEEEVAAVESALKIKLPTSYAAFLRRWNGGSLGSSRLLSTDQLIEYAEEYGFRPSDGKTESSDARATHFYAAKPAHFLIFRTFDLGEDAQCFDTARAAGGEYPICKYDAENQPEKNLRIRYPCFEALIMSEMLDAVGDGAVYENYLDVADDEQVERIEEFFGSWERRLLEMLEERGADLSDRVFPDWTHWK